MKNRSGSALFWWCFTPAVVVGVVFFGLVLWAAAYEINRPPECGSLARYAVEPGRAGAGETVTFLAPAGSFSEFAPEYSNVVIAVTDASGRLVLHGRSPINSDGGISFSFTIPASARPGKALVSATPDSAELPPTGPDVASSSSTPPSASAVGADLVRVSCSPPLGTLTIER